MGGRSIFDFFKCFFYQKFYGIGWGLCDSVCQVLVCRDRYGLGGRRSSLHSGIEFGRSRTCEGSSGGRKRGVV
jgi:hypothetical protein